MKIEFLLKKLDKASGILGFLASYLSEPLNMVSSYAAARLFKELSTGGD
jgi:hypothetical protein